VTCGNYKLFREMQSYRATFKLNDEIKCATREIFTCTRTATTINVFQRTL